MSNIYWNDPKKNFSKTHEFGADITKFVIDSDTNGAGDKVNDPRLEAWLRTGKVTSTKPDAKEPRMGEVESLKSQIADLKEQLKSSEFDENQVKTLNNKIKELEKSGDSGITQEQLDEAKAELQGTLDLIKESLANIQQGDKKEEIWDAVKSVKDLIEG